MTSFATLRTPAFVLDRKILSRNAASMTARMKQEGVQFRPHLKTAKSAKVAELVTAGNFGGITVSTINEAAYFSDHGFTDITYGICCMPQKLEAIASLQRNGTRVHLITDDVQMAQTIAQEAEALDTDFRVFIEVDTGLHRTGVDLDGQELESIARVLQEAPRLNFGGVFTHAGHSYHSKSIDQVKAIAEQERMGVVTAATRVRENGIPCPTVSVGSTPTALHAESFEGVTEVRAGTYMFNDLFQAGIHSCQMEDIAISVLTTIVSHSQRLNHYLIDAGMLALSQDTSANEHREQIGYGLVREENGTVLEGHYVADVHQEHGFIKSTKPIAFDKVPIGSRVRIVPNHACSTSAMFDQYHVVDGGVEVKEVWERTNGW